MFFSKFARQVANQIAACNTSLLCVIIANLDSYKFPINLLSRDYRTPIKRLQDSYQEIAGLLSRDCRTPINFL